MTTATAATTATPNADRYTVTSDQAVPTDQGPAADLATLGAGMLIEAVPTGTIADGTPITRPIRRRLDRHPWGYNAERGSVVISDGTGADVVNVDSIRILEAAAPDENVVDGRTVDPPTAPDENDRAFLAAEWAQAAEHVGDDEFAATAAGLGPYLDRDPAVVADLARYFHPDPGAPAADSTTDRADETGDDDQ